MALFVRYNPITLGAGGGGGGVTSVAPLDSTTPSANGAVIIGSQLYMQSATNVEPGLVNTITQTFAGDKTFTGTIGASNLSGTNTGDVTLGTANGLSLSSQVLSLALSSTSTTGALSSTDWNTFNNKQPALTIGDISDAGTDGIVITGGTGAVIGTGVTVAQHVTDATHNGYLLSTDWVSFNAKQPAGSYITALTGDVTATGPGSVAATIGVNKVTNSQLAQMPTLTLKGNNTGLTANALDLTVSQVNTMLGTVVNPMTTLGDTIYGAASGVPTRLAGNTTAVKQFLSQTGTGSVSAAPVWGALTSADIPAINLAASGNGGVTGTLGVGNGGTGQASNWTANGVIYAASTTALTSLTPGTAGLALTSGGTGAAPVWAVLSIAAGGTGQSTATAAFGALSPLTTKGDILSYSTLNVRHAVPGDYGSLIADSSQADGWRSATYTTVQNGRPGKNYIQYADFENNATTGWLIGTTGTLTNNIPTGTPTFNTTPAGTISFAVLTSTPLAGSASLNLVSGASRVAGDMYHTQAYSIDAADQAKVLSFRFYYTPSSQPTRMTFSGVASTSTFGVAVWDATNSVWLATTGTFDFVQNSGAGICQGTFQTGFTTASLRFCIYNANATAGACNLAIDDVYVGPQALAFGPPVSDWTAFTPTGSFTTNTTYTGQYRRVGDTVEVHAFLAFSGTPNNPSGLLINMPPGLVIDSSKIAGASSTLNGLMSSGRVTGTGVPINVLYSSTTAVDIRFMSTPSGTNPQTITNATGFSSTAPITFTNGSTIDLVFSVPVVGWSSNTVMSADSNTRVTAARAFGPGSGTLNSTFNLVTFTGVIGDTNAGFSGNNTYTVPVTGYYNLSAQLAITSNLAATNAVGVQIVNSTTGSTYATNFFRAAATVNSTFYPSVSVQGVFLTAGNAIVVKSYSDNTATFAGGGDTTYFTIAQVTGPAVVAASEKIRCKYTNTAGTSIANTGDNNVPFATKVFDTHNAWNGTQFIAPRSDYYTIRASINYASATYGVNNQLIASIYKNSALDSYGDIAPVMAIVTLPFGSVVDTIVFCNAGDALEVRAQNTRTAGATTLNTGAGFNHVEISA